MAEPAVRPCIVSFDHKPSEEGRFHRWGNTIYHDDANQAHDRTLAIVELAASGQVIEVDPHRVRFTG